MTKRVLSAVLAMTLILALFPTAFAAETVTYVYNDLPEDNPYAGGQFMHDTFSITNVVSQSVEPLDSAKIDKFSGNAFDWENEDVYFYFDDTATVFRCNAPAVVTFLPNEGEQSAHLYEFASYWYDESLNPTFTPKYYYYTDIFDLIDNPTPEKHDVPPSDENIGWVAADGFSHTFSEPGEYMIVFRDYNMSMDVKLGVFFITVEGGDVPAPSVSNKLTVNPTASTVLVNGVPTAFEAYLINGNNFFKMRDLANVLSGTNKQFAVGYDEATGAITLTSGQPYVAVGGEMAQGDGTDKEATLNSSILISKDGAPVAIMAYLINGNNFVKLRDVMQLFNIGVTYDEVTGNIGIDTSIGYTE